MLALVVVVEEVAESDSLFAADRGASVILRVFENAEVKIATVPNLGTQPFTVGTEGPVVLVALLSDLLGKNAGSFFPRNSPFFIASSLQISFGLFGSSNCESSGFFSSGGSGAEVFV